MLRPSALRKHPPSHPRPAGPQTRLLRCDLHLHTDDDPYDRIRHDIFALVDRAVGLGLNCLAVTNHLMVTRRPDAEDHARARGVLLLTGVELTVEGRHVLFINPPSDLEPSSIRRFRDLQPFRREESLVIPAHPFFPGPTHFGHALEEHADLWDAVEHCNLYTRLLDFNRRSAALSASLGLPLVATSDTHDLSNMGSSFVEVEAEPNALSLAQAVRAGRHRIRSRPRGVLEAARVAWTTFRTTGQPAVLPPPGGESAPPGSLAERSHREERRPAQR